MIKKSQNHAIKNNDALKTGVYISYASTIITIVVQLVYTPIMVRLLGQSEYGLYSLVGSVVSYLSLFNLGLTGAYMRFYSRYKMKNDQEKIAGLNGMFLVLFLLLALTAFICGNILASYPEKIFGSRLTQEQINRSQILMRLLVFNLALTFPAGLFYSVIDVNERFVFHRIVDLSGVIINPFVALPLLFMGYGSVTLVVITTLITVTKLAVNMSYCCKKLNMKFRFKNFDFGLFKEIGTFSFFLFINMIIEQLNWNVDKLILGHVSGTVVVAVYAVGSQMNMVVIDFLTTISNVFSPRVNMIAATGNHKEKFNELFIKIGRIQFIVLGLIGSGFFFFGKYFLTDIYVGKAYEDSYIVTLLLLFPEMIALVQSVGVEMQRALNKHQFRSIVYLFMSILNVLISIPLSVKWGAVGSAAGTMISLFVSHGIIMNIYYHKVMKLDVFKFWKNIFILARCLIVPIICGIIMMSAGINSLWKFLIFGIIYLLIYCGSVWFFGMNDSEKELIRLKK